MHPRLEREAHTAVQLAAAADPHVVAPSVLGRRDVAANRALLTAHGVSTPCTAWVVRSAAARKSTAAFQLAATPTAPLMTAATTAGSLTAAHA